MWFLLILYNKIHLCVHNNVTCRLYSTLWCHYVATRKMVDLAHPLTVDLLLFWVSVVSGASTKIQRACIGKKMVSQAFAPTVLAIESIILLVLAFYLLYRYGDIRRQNIFVTALTVCIWFLSFFTVFLLPIDVSSVSSSCPCVCSSEPALVHLPSLTGMVGGTSLASLVCCAMHMDDESCVLVNPCSPRTYMCMCTCNVDGGVEGSLITDVGPALLPLQAFYNDCLSTKTVPDSNCSAPKDLLAADNGSNCSLNCSLLVCSDYPLPPSKEDDCSSLCPEGHYAFICQVPIKVLWIIINWLFTILTWWVRHSFDCLFAGVTKCALLAKFAKFSTW